MAVNIEAPQMGESITEATVATWVKKEGDVVKEDDLVAELETEKINLEVTAPKAGKITALKVQEGDTVSPGDVMAELDATQSAETQSAETKNKSDKETQEESASTGSTSSKVNLDDYSPAVRRLLSENSLNPEDITATGKGGKLTKEDVENHIKTDKAPAQKETTENASQAAVQTPQKDAKGERQ